MKNVTQVFSDILVKLDLLGTETVLICGSNFIVNDFARLFIKSYSRVKLIMLDDLDLDIFVTSVEVPAADQYDIIIALDLLEELEWDSRLIQAMGLHLKQSGRLWFYFGEKTKISNFLWVHNHMYANWFQRTNLEVITGTNIVACCSERFKTEVVYLQKQLCENVRQKLSFLLQRIEYDINVDSSVEELKALCCTNNVSNSYLRRFINGAVLNPSKVNREIVKRLR